jgi:hypothetical protein
MMHLPKMPGTLAGLAMGAAVAAGGAMPVLGAGVPVWDVRLDTSSNTYGPSYVQYKNDNRAIGDVVHLQPGTPRGLQNIVIPMALYSYDTSHEYVATDLRLTLYNVDANGIPTTEIAHVVTSNSFTGSNSLANSTPPGASRPAIYLATEYVTFDFSSLNIDLPDNFAFTSFDYTVDGDPDLSTWLMAADSVDGFGSTPVNDPNPDQWHFLRHNSLATWEVTPGPFWEDGWQAVAQINVPEPASLGAFAAGGLLLLRRRQS